MTRTIFYLVAIAVVCIFRIPIETLIDTYIIQYLMKHVESNWLITISLSFISGTTIYLALDKYKKAYRKYFVLKVFMIAVWVYYRFVSEKWVLYPITDFDTIKQLDIVVLPFIISAMYDVCLHVYHTVIERVRLIIEIAIMISQKIWFKETDRNKSKQERLHKDMPIQTYAEDLFGLKEHVLKIKSNIFNTNQNSKETSLTIGIVAPWGHGKSSFLHLLEEEISKECIIVKFSPQIYENNTLTKSFFDELASQLKPHGLNTNSLNKYSAKLTGTSNSIVDLAARTIQICTNKSLQEEFNGLEKQLSAIEKKIVVFIDDIDRLDADEIISTLKLIRDTANFSNITYIVTMDKSYVLETLHERKVNNASRYLEKFFHHEVYLPQIPKRKIKDNLWKLIQESIREESKEEVDYLKNALSKENKYSNSSVCLLSIHNMRDIIKVANLFNSRIRTLQHEVNLVDLMNLCILNYKYPAVYARLEYHYKSMLRLTSARSVKGEYYILDNEKQKELLNDDDYNLKSLCLTKEQLVEAKNIIDRYLFTSNKVTSVSNCIRINYEYSIDRYFQNKKPDGISHSIFLQIFAAEYSQFDKVIAPQLYQWCQLGLHKDLIERIGSIRYTESNENYKKIMRSYFYLASNGKNIDISAIDQKINDTLQRSALQSDAHKVFLKEVFTQYSPKDFATGYIYDNLLDNPNFNIISEEELQEICIAHFESYLNSKFIDQSIILYFWEMTIFKTFTIKKLDVSGHPVAHEKILGPIDYVRGNKLLVNYIKDHSDSVFNSFIIQSQNKQYKMRLDRLWHQEQKAPFDDVIEQIKLLDKDKYITEFLEFYEKYERNNVEATAFPFKYILPER